jgi:hypothetical protein
MDEPTAKVSTLRSGPRSSKYIHHAFTIAPDVLPNAIAERPAQDVCD